MRTRTASFILLAAVILANALANASAPVAKLSKLAPASGPVGTVVTVTGSGFAAKGNTAMFGPGYLKNLDSTDGTAFKFTVPEGLDLCDPESLRPCPGAYPQVRPGEYVVMVIATGEKSNGLTFTVTQK